jgi:glyoxalase superfamily protein
MLSAIRLHHIVVDAHDLPALARFWTQALRWKVLSERENEIVIGTEENAPAGCASCRSPTPKRSRAAYTSTSPAAPRTAIRRSAADRAVDVLPAVGLAYGGDGAIESGAAGA